MLVDDETIDFVAAAYQADARAAREKGAPLGQATGPGAAKASRAGSRSGGGLGERRCNSPRCAGNAS